MRLWKRAVSAAIMVGALSGSALAGPPMDWTQALTWEPGATFSSSMPDSEFSEVGVISAFDAPFGDLNPATKEYSFHVYGLVSQGTDTVGSPGLQFYTTYYTGGFIEIYCDSTPDASYDANPPNAGVPADFTDGELILSGVFTSFFTQTNDFTSNDTGNLEGEITWTGGTLLERTENGSGQPCTGLFTGGITWKASVLAPYPGYVFHHDGKIDLNCPVPTEPSTWGRIKSMYR